ncbi:hypothetical protein KIW84_071210 [Lathyrus oleraceus]|uniref:Pyruvate carboxyltransferase domain-containing protein n=1 Tax=Pisum sativum TaxID=3888 RepID=A0A9D4VI58_PEA|nr:hypothetical protein KIW84_071210 [Pisum sativum]
MDFFEQLEVTINRIGERARNASLEEVVMALKCGGHIFNNLHTEILLGTWVPALNIFESSLRRRNCAVARRNTESMEERAVGIMQVTPVTTREKELHLQVTQLQQSTGSLVDELRRQKMKNVRLERQLSSVNNKIEK